MRQTMSEYTWATRCYCHGVEVGSKNNAVAVRAPWGQLVEIDRCVLPDILALWFDLGIPTIESCCGHGKNNGYIAVDERYRQRMLDLGFKYDEGCYVTDKGLLTPSLQRRDLWAWPINREVFSTKTN